VVKTAAWSIPSAWLLAVAGVLVVALTPARPDYLVWLPIACGASLVLALAMQVATRTPDGFVWRASLAFAGVVVLYAIGALVLWLFAR